MESQNRHAAMVPDDWFERAASTDPELRRRVFDAFRLAVGLDRTAGQIHVKALISSAFTGTRDLQNLVANRAIAGAGFEQTSATAYCFTEVRQI